MYFTLRVLAGETYMSVVVHYCGETRALRRLYDDVCAGITDA